MIPEIYESTFVNKHHRTTAEETWAYDKFKKDIAESKGYEVLVVWENDYHINRKETIDKYLKFLENAHDIDNDT